MYYCRDGGGGLFCCHATVVSLTCGRLELADENNRSTFILLLNLTF